MKKKEMYEAPLVETFELHLENNLLQGPSEPKGVNWSPKSGGVSGDDTYDDGMIY